MRRVQAQRGVTPVPTLNKIVADLLRRHLHVCPVCGEACDSSVEASYTPDGGDTWLSAFQTLKVLLRCENEQCDEYRLIQVLDLPR